MRIWNRLFLSLILLFPYRAYSQWQGFSADSAYAYTHHLSVTIGPRPMGSANEQAALRWAVQKFAEFGADTAFVLDLTKAKTRNTVLNTHSGTAVGVFKGETDSTIVIGGHIDSSAREHPGANDDASGTACAVELARLWSQRPRHYTLVFATFGGEESGLIGSKHFVGHYPDIDDVVLMLHVDMAGATGPLIPFIESGEKQTPEWLVEDAFAVERTVGSASLRYPVYFFSLNAPLGAASSDHSPFIEKGIPAITFTAGVSTSPVHTQQDKIEFVDKTMLARSGNLVDGLIKKYQAHGIPAPRTGDYLLWPIWGGRFFIPAWLVLSLVILSLVLGAWAFMYSRERRLQIPKTERVRFSGWKLLLIMALIAIFTQLGEAGMQLLKGLRYPWLAHVNKYLIFAAIWAVAGIWSASQLTRLWRFSPDPYVYTKRALGMLVVFILLLGIASLRLALHPSLTLVLISLAIFVPSPLFKLVIGLIAPVPMFKLMFMEVFPFLAHNFSLIGFGIDSSVKAFLYSATITALLVIWYLPSIYFYSYLLVSIKPLQTILQRLRNPVVGTGLLLAIFGYGGYLYSFPAYTEMWRARISVNADYDMQSGESELKLVGNEYFRNVTVTTDSLNRHYDDKIHHDDLPIAFQANWMTVAGTETLRVGQDNTVDIDWLIASSKPWLRAQVTIQADTLGVQEVSSELGFTHKDEQARFTWYSEPPDSLQLKANLTLTPGARLIREIKATYAEMPVAIEVTADLAEVRYRTSVVRRDTLAVLGTQSTQK
ncbi:MAG: M28 family peptidase [bacterium]